MFTKGISAYPFMHFFTHERSKSALIKSNEIHNWHKNILVFLTKLCIFSLVSGVKE